MRMSDWSSDVCSSDLVDVPDPRRCVGEAQVVQQVGSADQIQDAAPMSLGRGADQDLAVPGRIGVPWRDQRMAAADAVACRLAAQHVSDEGAEQRQAGIRSEEHTSELQSLMRISYAVFCLKKKKTKKQGRAT